MFSYNKQELCCICLIIQYSETSENYDLNLSVFGKNDNIYHSTKHFMCQSPDVCFHPSPGEVSAGWYGIALDVWLFGPSAFRFRSRSRKPISWFFSIAYTDPGCGCVLWGLWTSIYLNSRPSAIITFNMPNIWQTVRNSKTINILYLPEGQSFRPHPPHIDFVAKIQ